MLFILNEEEGPEGVVVEVKEEVVELKNLEVPKIPKAPRFEP